MLVSSHIIVITFLKITKMILLSISFFEIKVSLLKKHTHKQFSGINSSIIQIRKNSGFLSFSSFMKFSPHLFCLSSEARRKLLPRCYYYKHDDKKPQKMNKKIMKNKHDHQLKPLPCFSEIQVLLRVPLFFLVSSDIMSAKVTKERSHETLMTRQCNH